MSCALAVLIFVVTSCSINALRVTVSYFEWLKNLEHKELGLLIRRYEHQSKKQLYDMLSVSYSKEDVEKLKGPTERDLVYSGLEEIMCTATKENWEFSVKNNLIFRDACLVNGIHKVY